MDSLATVVSILLSLILLFLNNCEAQAQADGPQRNVSLPISLRPQVTEAIEEACLSNAQRQMLFAQVNQAVDDLVDGSILPVLSPPPPGLTREFPASSCRNISRPSGYYWISNLNREAVRVYCEMDIQRCGNARGWARIAYINMAISSHQCPTTWREITAPRRACGPVASNRPGCSSAFFTTQGLNYTRIHGRVTGYQYASTNAFSAYINANNITIDDYYLDGVSITRGQPELRQHIWSFAAATGATYTDSSACPCTRSDSPWPYNLPPFVGQDYFCDTGNPGPGYTDILYADNPLWDGEGCMATSSCCQFNNPPSFCKQVSTAVADSIEVRICTDDPVGETPVQLLELYIQ